MEDSETRSNISLKFNEFNNGVEVYDIVDRSLAEEKNLDMNTCSYAPKLGDIVETVNMRKNIDEIQKELRTALSGKSRVSRSRNTEICSVSAEREHEEPRV